jgi:L-lactate dehydrogenase complex protein LldE
VTFCVKYPDISNAITEKKAEVIERTGADLLRRKIPGCLMNMAGKLNRRGIEGALFPHHRDSGGGGNAPAIEKPNESCEPA